jgi:hypothetical protein
MDKMIKLLVSFAIAGALLANTKGGSKSYTVNITEPSTVAGAQLKPGEYRMKIVGSEAVFTDNQSRQIVKAPVTLSTAAKKFDYTEVVWSKASDNSEQVDSIRIEGTKLEYDFKR